MASNSRIGQDKNTAPVRAGALKIRPLVAAIDFGTTYSGYAFQSHADFEENPLSVKANNWDPSTRGLSRKIPSCILFDKEKQFHSFGKDAENKYNEAVADGRQYDWYFFKRFKMVLYNEQELTRTTVVHDDKGLEMPAMQVFTASIKYLKDHLLQSLLTNRDKSLTTEDKSLINKDKSSTNKDESLTTEDKSLTNKDKSSTNKDESLTTKDKSLTNKDKSSTSKDESLTTTDIKVSDIHWVITVPAIWTDSAKRFMREAAINAEIDTAYLSLSLEPEAASLFCRYLPVEKVVGADRAEIRSLKAGDRYMIIDAGGGTVDITIHEILEDSTLKEFAKANGGEWGGTKVDEKFEQLLNDVFGLDVMEVIQQHFRDDFLAMKQTFEFVKRSVSPDMSGSKKIRIPSSFINKYKELKKVDLDKTTLIPAHLQKKVTFDNDKMTIDADLLKGLYEEVCDQICAIADEFFQQMKQYNVDKILMVGGFSQSAMLQDKVKKTFPNCRVIIPEDADLAVLKGAVLFGHNPKMIVARVCKYSYGIRAMKHYEPGIDPKDKRVVQGDIVLCKDYFSKHATVGQEFNTEAKVYSQEYLPSDATGTELEVWVYTSPNKHPIYIDDEGCRKLGEIQVNLQDIASEGHSVKIQFKFGKTEIKVKVIDTKTNLEVKSANFKML